MSDTTPETIAQVGRTLRLKDLAAFADAIPLPVSLIPSAVPQPLADEPDVAADPHATEHSAQAAPIVPDGGMPSVSTSPIVPDDFVADDAVLNSINAAIDAVRASLPQDVGGPEAVSPAGLADHQDADRQDSASDDIDAVATPSVSVALSATATTTTDDHSSSTVAVGAVVAPSVELAGPQLPQPHEIVQGATAAVDQLVDGAISLVSNGAAAIALPSLDGLGTDALAGLLQVASAAADTLQHTDASLDTLDDLIGLAAVGLPEVFHADQLLGHDAHSPLGLVGSGLI